MTSAAKEGDRGSVVGWGGREGVMADSVFGVLGRSMLMNEGELDLGQGRGKAFVVFVLAL